MQNIAAKKMTHFIGMGVDQTFGFNQGKMKLAGCGAVVEEQ